MSILTSATSPKITCSTRCARFNAFKLRVQPAYLAAYRARKTGKNVTKMANTNTPAGQGQKATLATERQKGSANLSQREPKDYSWPRPAPPRPAPGAYTLHLLHFCHEKTSVCFGCRDELKPTLGEFPKSHKDLVIISQTRQSYKKDGQVHLQPKPSNVYFHANESCVKLHNNYYIPALLRIADDVKPHLDNSHNY